MNQTGTFISPEKYYEEAKIMLEKKELLGFMSKIGTAIEASANDPEMLAKTTFLQVEALLKFNQHTNVLECLPLALEHNTGAEAFRLREYMATAKGFLGYVNEAINIYKELLDKATTEIEIVRLCIGLTWAYTTLDTANLNDVRLNEVKSYFDLALEHFNTIPDNLKRKLYNNYGVYYFYKRDYANAIDSINRAFEYSDEKDYPKLYNNLAEICLGRDKYDIILSEVKEYTAKSEVIATKYNDAIEMGKAFFTQAKAELRSDQLFAALDTLYMAFETFKEAEAIAYAVDCLVLINQTVNDFKSESMTKLQQKLKNSLRNSPYQLK